MGIGIQANSTIESDQLRSGRNRGMTTIRDRPGRMSQRKGRDLSILAFWLNLRPASRGGRGPRRRAKQQHRQPEVQIELTYNTVSRELHYQRGSHRPSTPGLTICSVYDETADLRKCG